MLHEYMPRPIDHKKRAEALRQRLAGVSSEVIARQLGVHPGTIRAWVQGQIPKTVGYVAPAMGTKLGAYFLGLFVADGWLSRDAVFIALNDKQLIDDLAAATDYRRKITVIRLRKWRTKQFSGRLSYRIRYGRDVFEVLKALGFDTEKTGNEFIPTVVQGDALPHFLRGLSDGDGTINITQNRGKKILQWGLISASKPFLEKVLNVLQATLPLSQGVKVLPKKTRTGTVFKIQLGYQDSRTVCSFMYGDAFIRLERKHAVWQKSQELLSPRPYRRWSEAEKQLVTQAVIPKGRTKAAYDQMAAQLKMRAGSNPLLSCG